jgi:hypothetical protein
VQGGQNEAEQKRRGDEPGDERRGDDAPRRLSGCRQVGQQEERPERSEQPEEADLGGPRGRGDVQPDRPTGQVQHKG